MYKTGEYVVIHRGSEHTLGLVSEVTDIAGLKTFFVTALNAEGEATGETKPYSARRLSPISRYTGELPRVLRHARGD